MLDMTKNMDLYIKSVMVSGNVPRYMPLKTPVSSPAVAAPAPAPEPTASAAPAPAAPEPVAALPGPHFALRPSVGTWYTPLVQDTWIYRTIPDIAVYCCRVLIHMFISFNSTFNIFQCHEHALASPTASLMTPVFSFLIRCSEEEKSDGLWNAPRMLNIKGLGRSVAECCEAERVLTKALFEMLGER